MEFSPKRLLPFLPAPFFLPSSPPTSPLVSRLPLCVSVCLRLPLSLCLCLCFCLSLCPHLQPRLRLHLSLSVIVPLPLSCVRQPVRGRPSKQGSGLRPALTLPLAVHSSFWGSGFRHVDIPPREWGCVPGQAALQAAAAVARSVLCVAGPTGPATFQCGRWTQPRMMEGGLQASPGQRSNHHLGLKSRVGRVPHPLGTPRWHLTLLPKCQVPEVSSLAHAPWPCPESLA